MSAASRRLSPSASLLRGSRLFALPQPLPPAVTGASATSGGYSDTATTPYPTYAAIETSSDARSRGEWGLKRPLPLKSTTNTGTPYIRIKDGIDTREHITNFEAAADHVLTLKKFQALNIPVLLQDATGRNADPVGQNSTPFDEWNTWRPAKHRPGPKRWRTDGPWLPGMSNARFDWWLNGGLKHPGLKRSEKETFQNYLRREMIEEIVHQNGISETSAEASWIIASKTLETFIDTARAAGDDTAVIVEKALLQAGFPVNPRGNPSMQQPPKTTNPELRASINSLFRNYLRVLRASPAKFASFLQQHFDLADTSEKGIDNDGEPLEWKIGPADQRDSSLMSYIYRLTGMPSTHPSAGLGYLRAAAVARNHPLYGPQSQSDPIQARVLQPGVKGVVDRRREAKLGAAGFVSESNSSLWDGRDSESNLREFVPQPGGNKHPVRPTHAFVTPEGRTTLSLAAPSSDKVVMAGLKKSTDPEEYLRRRQNGQSIGGRMPRLDGNYTAHSGENSSRLIDAISKNREGLNSMLSGTRQRPQKEDDMIGMLDEMMSKAGQ
ncbi:hypothetical protein UCRPC4_g03610 [Phaeomoniella chlamydospora]|uniref:Uncharacterized protein n=1 Tax=Phaeomoniella chlamydospora TaxID=158046 RepID=A0A0G2EH12_PHACM|nr:hypothetical protein UCRPC4_g03610 [Phaeomoniella chlamydospora]